MTIDTNDQHRRLLNQFTVLEFNNEFSVCGILQFLLVEKCIRVFILYTKKFTERFDQKLVSK